MKFISVYYCWLFDEVKKGKKIYALDRRLNTVYSVNNRTVDELVAIMNSAEEEPSRYEFWYEEKVTEETEKVTEETEENENAEEL